MPKKNLTDAVVPFEPPKFYKDGVRKQLVLFGYDMRTIAKHCKIEPKKVDEENIYIN